MRGFQRLSRHVHAWHVPCIQPGMAIRTRAGWLVLLSAGLAYAKPPAAKVFCEVYPSSALCSGGQTSCSTCHTTPPARNAYGRDVEGALALGVQRPLSDDAFARALPSALTAVDAYDADEDGVANGEEIRTGRAPYQAQGAANELCVSPDPSIGLAWDVCRYDVGYAYRKVMLDICGRSATLAEQASAKDRSAIHTAAATCLQSNFWRGRDGVVWNLANPKIKPVQSIKAGADAGPVPLADYEDDYALFVYTQIDNHDARDVLRAKYFVSASTALPTTYATFDRSPAEDAASRPGRNAAQTIDAPNRAGMITTRWFRIYNTMFTPVPRTTAAQAYRSYLGLDIALLQGLQDSETAPPADYDRKGVSAEGCATCHRTLDPLSYPFSRYEAIDRDRLSGRPGYETQYRKDRMNRFVDTEGARILEVPEAGRIFGTPVQTLTEWAEVASASDAFARKVVLDYWRILVGGDPETTQSAVFDELVARFRGVHAYSVDKMIHDILDTEAYGVP